MAGFINIGFDKTEKSRRIIAYDSLKSQQNGDSLHFSSDIE
jgi:hypothetical protein